MSATARDGAGWEAVALAVSMIRPALAAGAGGVLLGVFTMVIVARRSVRELGRLSRLLAAAVAEAADTRHWTATGEDRP